MLRFGVFRALVHAHAKSGNLAATQIQYSVKQHIKEALPSIAHLLDEWAKPLRATQASESVQSTSLVIAEDNESAGTVRERDRGFVSPIGHDVGHTGSSPSHDAFTRAISQVEEIARLVRQGKDAQADQYLH